VKSFFYYVLTENGERRTENGERRTENGETALFNDSGFLLAWLVFLDMDFTPYG